jgi:hypothetical protein
MRLTEPERTVVYDAAERFVEAALRRDETMRECAELGIKHVWMHRGPGGGSVSKSATDYGRQQGITVIDGGCPLMFGPTSDFGHKVIKVIYSGSVPKQV